MCLLYDADGGTLVYWKCGGCVCCMMRWRYPCVVEMWWVCLLYDAGGGILV